MRDKAGLTVASAPWDEQSGGYFIHCTNTFSEKQYVNTVAHPDQPTTREILHHRFGHVSSKYLKRLKLKKHRSVRQV